MLEISYNGEMDKVRQFILDHFEGRRDMNMSTVSKALGRNHAYLNQFIKRGSPQHFPERTRKRLAEILGVDENKLRLDVNDAFRESTPELQAEAPTPQFRPGHPPPKRRSMGSRDLPVYSCAEAGGGTLVLSGDPIEYVPRPDTLEGIPDAYAVLIIGESMVPAFRPGDVAWVNPRFPPQRDTEVIVISSYEEQGEARAMIKTLVRWDKNTWFLFQYNPKKELKASRLEWQACHRVVGKFSRR